MSLCLWCVWRTVRSMRELIFPSSWLMEVGLCHSFLAKSAGLFSATLRAFPKCFEIDEKSKDCAMESHIRRHSSPQSSLELKSSPFASLFHFLSLPLYCTVSNTIYLKEHGHKELLKEFSWMLIRFP